MSHEVKVIFIGMCMWWLPQSGDRWVLLPDLSTADVPHTASLSAPPSAFVNAACPDRFEPAAGKCVFNLNSNGAPGGVQIALLTNQAAGAFTTGAFCEIPRLGPATTLQLRSAFTPPNGTGNAAWMEATGGNPHAVFDVCPHPEEGCPRVVHWRVPVSNESNVVLSLSNVKTAGAPATLLVQLADGATINVVNEPPDDVLAARHPSTAMEMLAGKDWCDYYRMLEQQDHSAVTCTDPLLNDCGTLSVRKVNAVVSQNFTTLACSNSQYP